MENAQKFQFPQELNRGKENEDLRQMVDSHWNDALTGSLLWGPFITAIPSLQAFNRLLTSPAQFRANVGCIVDFMEVVGAYAHTHEGRLVCRIVSITLNLVWAAVESCRQEPGWSAVADDLASRAARMIERHDTCCCLRNKPEHLFDGTSRIEGDPLFPCNVAECQAELTSLKAEKENRLKPMRRARDIAWSALHHAWNQLRHFQQEFEYVSGDELVVRRPMPDAIRYLSNIGLAACVFVRTAIGRKDYEPRANEFLVDEDGHLSDLIFGEEDAPSAFERAQRAECLARMFEALVQAEIAIVKSGYWRQSSAARPWDVLGHQAIAYANQVQSHWSWMVALICHRPERALDEETVNEVWHVKRLGDAAEANANCFEAQMLLIPRVKLKLPPAAPPQRRPRPENTVLLPAALPALQDKSDRSPAEVRSQLFSGMGADFAEDRWLVQRGSIPSWSSSFQPHIDAVSPKVRLVGFDSTRKAGRGHIRRQHGKRNIHGTPRALNSSANS